MTTAAVRPGERSGSRRPVATVLLATDLSAASEHATERAIEAAAAYRARLVVVNVLERRRLHGLGSHDRVDQARAEREAALESLAQRARTSVSRCEYLLWSGDPGSSIVAAAEAERADLIVVGTHGRDRAGRILLGSVSGYLVGSAPCPVMVVRPERATGRHGAWGRSAPSRGAVEPGDGGPVAGPPGTHGS